MTAMATRKEIDEAFARIAEDYRRQRARSQEWAEGTLQLGQDFLDVKKLIPHGEWLPTIEAWGMSYDQVANHMRAVKWGATVEMLMEHGLTGTLELLSRQRRAARLEAEGDPEPEPDPAPAEDGKFCSSTKFEGGDAEHHSDSSEPAAAPAQPVIQAWEAVRERLLEAVGEPSFKAWLADLGMEARDGAAVLLARTTFNRDRVRQEFGERISRFLEEELPGVRLEYGVAEAAPGPAPALPLAKDAVPVGGGDINLVPKPDLLDLKKAGDRMASCALFHDLKPHERFFLSVIAYRDGPTMNGWVVSNNELRAIFGRSESTIQRWSRACQKAGYLRVTDRPNRWNRYEAFPDGLPYNRQYQLALMRVIDLNREPSRREAAESAAARPAVGVNSDTPGVAAVSGRGVNTAAQEGSAAATRNRMETEEETAADRRQPSQALAAGRRQ